MKAGPGLLIVAASVAISIPINGILIETTWAWFAAPIFGLRAITFAEAVGLAIFVSTLAPIRGLPKVMPEPNETEDAAILRSLGNMATWTFFMPALTFLCAWAWHFLMGHIH